MKIFRLFENDNKEAVCCLPDTALLNTKQPFFVPDFTQQCVVQLCFVAQITRLGRSIYPEFANRYYNAQSLTLGVNFIARDLLNQLVSEKKPWDLAIGFDSAVAVASHGNLLLSENAILKINDISYTIKIPHEIPKKIDSFISRISQFFTLRQGDILLFPLTNTELSVTVNDTLQLQLDDNKILAFHIK